MLIDTGRLLTCRHVVAKHTPGHWERPDVWITFPGIPAIGARVLYGGEVDAVVLDLMTADDDPRLPRPVPLSGSARQPARVEVFGYPTSDHTAAGVWRDFEVAGVVDGEQYQLNWNGAGSLPGHSGGPVVDAKSGRLVGLLTAGSQAGRFDRYLPLTTLLSRGVLARLPWLMEGDDAQGHFTRRSRGHRGQTSGSSVFTGRWAARERIHDWLVADQAPGDVLVITGQPGAGKSAVLARVGLDLSEELSGSRGLLFHARQATAADFRTAVADLTGAADDSGPGQLLAGVDDAARGQVGDRRCVIIVDGLDEVPDAKDRRQIASQLTQLARRPWVRAAVATRWMATDPFAPASLLREFGITSARARHLVFLDAPEYFAPTDLAEYTSRLLAQEGVKYPPPSNRAWRRYRSDHHLRERLAAVVAQRAGSNFLVAALSASRLAEAYRVRDPRDADFDPAKLAASIGSALEAFLDGHGNGALLRGALTSLAYAPAAGYTDHAWQAAAAALGYPLDQLALDRIRRGNVADYLLQTTTDTAGIVTRLFHQALVDQLLADRDTRQDQANITKALTPGTGHSTR
ncbi:S1 family peptidase [Phytohabitans houttuyneae]|uniref:S1 family peptidase n=1 Tax=Phytohabitans houttuyneae TaxID=1076126 RepID=UPI0031E6018F